MEATYIDYSETNSFSSALISYINKDPKLNPFISYQADFEGFEQIIKNKKVLADRNVLVKVLREQYAKKQPSSETTLNLQTDSGAVLRNIELLAKPNTYTVTTGHQLNIFTGPLYFIFKIVTAIKLASDLKEQFPEKNFVPIYWMASEDHDFEEINHTNIGCKKIIWEHDAHGATGRLKLEGIQQAVREFSGVLGGSEKALQLSKIIATAYTQCENLVGATRYLVNALFEKYGLVCIDADNPELKKQFSPYIIEDILQQHSFKNITDTDRKLQEIGIEPQVFGREINFFYLQDNLRERIVFEDKLYRVLNTEISFTQDELVKEIKHFPERFSPNVVMRPLYQEIILPNIAYIGGGAEIVYWLQLKQNFDYYRVDFPILIPRNSALIIDQNLRKKLNRLELKLTDLFKKTEELQKEWVLAHTQHTLDLKEEWNELEEIFTKLKSRAIKIDITLGPSTEAVKVRLGKAVSNLERKLLKAEKKNYDEATQLISTIRNKIFPGGGLQERTENFGLFYVKHGPCFISELIKHFVPLDFKFSVLEESCD